MTKKLSNPKILNTLVRLRFLAFAVGIIVSILMIRLLIEIVKQDVDKDLNSQIEIHLSQLSERIEGYADTMYSFRGIFAINPDLSQEEWDLYISSFNLAERYPQNSALSYVEVLGSNEIIGSDIKNISTNPEHYYVKYTSAANAPNIINIDLSNDLNRVKTIEAARDSGKIIVTPPITSVASDVKLVAFYMPIYDYNFIEKDATVEDRRQNIQGFMSLAIRLDTFVEDLFNISAFENFKLTVTDSESGVVVYDKGLDLGSQLSIKEENLDLLIAQRLWNLEFTTDRISFIRRGGLFAFTALIISGITANLFILSVLELQAIRAKKENESK